MLPTNQSNALGGALPAGEGHLGAVGGNTAYITVVPVLSVHNAYANNDYIGTDHVAMDFATAARVNGGTGVIQSAILADYAFRSCAMELWLFNTAPAGLPDDSAAFSLADADSALVIGVISFSTYYGAVNCSVSQAQNVGIAFKADAADRSIFGALVLRGVPAGDWANGDITVRLGILQD